MHNITGRVTQVKTYVNMCVRKVLKWTLISEVHDELSEHFPEQCTLNSEERHEIRRLYVVSQCNRTGNEIIPLSLNGIMKNIEWLLPFSENSRTCMLTQFVKVVPPGQYITRPNTRLDDMSLDQIILLMLNEYADVSSMAHDPGSSYWPSLSLTETICVELEPSADRYCTYSRKDEACMDMIVKRSIIF